MTFSGKPLSWVIIEIYSGCLGAPTPGSVCVRCSDVVTSFPRALYNDNDFSSWRSPPFLLSTENQLASPLTWPVSPLRYLFISLQERWDWDGGRLSWNSSILSMSSVALEFGALSNSSTDPVVIYLSRGSQVPKPPIQLLNRLH